MIRQHTPKFEVSADIVVVGLGPVGATLANLLGLVVSRRLFSNVKLTPIIYPEQFTSTMK
jgi:hypothetical protein